jgi:aminoglycoside phosphotransferase (APT) family kinase protein
MSSSLPVLVDETSLRAYLNEHLPGNEDIVVRRHQAGHSNETFFVIRGSVELVLRRPPRGAFLPSAHDVGREYRVLSALKETPVRVPRTVLTCEDTTVIGAPFYVMERVDGHVIRDELPAYLTEEHRAAIGDELVDALVELHAVNPSMPALDGFGKPSGYLERQLRRWNGQLELTLPHTRHLPTSPPTVVVHGDYKLDNVILRSGVPPHLVAILDWEMSTLGDPLADLGWMTSFWLEAADAEEDLFARTSRVTQLPGFKSRAELIDRYAQATGRDLSTLSWYQVLAIWKLAILLEGSYARHLAGMTDDPFFAHLEDGVPGLARRALQVARA